MTTMKTQKIFSTLVLVLATSFIATGCSSKKAQANADTAATDVSAMKATKVANAKLGKASSGRAR